MSQHSYIGSQKQDIAKKWLFSLHLDNYANYFMEGEMIIEAEIIDQPYSG